MVEYLEGIDGLADSIHMLGISFDSLTSSDVDIVDTDITIMIMI
jgi:hypothetical protein